MSARKSSTHPYYVQARPIGNENSIKDNENVNNNSNIEKHQINSSLKANSPSLHPFQQIVSNNKSLSNKPIPSNVLDIHSPKNNIVSETTYDLINEKSKNLQIDTGTKLSGLNSNIAVVETLENNETELPLIRSANFNTNTLLDKTLHSMEKQQLKPLVKICAKCGLQINQRDKEKPKETVLKALGKYYHEHCFSCHDCSTQLKKKYFPYKNEQTKEIILLCQYHYFYRHGLLCYVCDKPLRGLYYTAFDKRFDEEHFSCTICKEPCGVKKCFIYDDQLYCKYHFLKYFSKRCKGCSFPISDQYIEFPKGKEIHCWHPECYGIHKYWHTTLSPENLAIEPLQQYTYDPKLLEDIKKRNKSEDPDTPTTFDPKKVTEAEEIETQNSGYALKKVVTLSNTPSDVDKEEMNKSIKLFNSILSKTWSIMYRFEEETAATITDMFQYSTIVDQIKAVEATALFVLKIECLFKALEPFSAFDQSIMHSKVIEDIHGTTTNSNVDNINYRYSKLPKKISSKLMVYLQLLRKLNTESDKHKIEITSFMSIITSVAHFLKLLTRYGLFSALKESQITSTNTHLLKFLREVEKNELYKSDPFKYIKVTAKMNDNCSKCNKYIQEECVQYGDNRIHLSCFKCDACDTTISKNDISEATYNNKLSRTLCSNCSSTDPESTLGFRYVSSLTQLVYLLKLALVQSEIVMEAHLKNKTNLNHPSEVQDALSKHQTYVRTLNDIKRLKSRREWVPLSNDEQNARRSVVVDTPETPILQNDIHKRNGGLIIETDREPAENVIVNESAFGNTKSLTLDDISRIVAAEQARELRPNAFTHFNKLKEADEDETEPVQIRSGVYYSEISEADLQILRCISISLLNKDENNLFDTSDISGYLYSCISSGNKPILTSNSSNGSGFWSKMKIAMNIENKKTENLDMFGSPLGIICQKWGVDSDLGIGPSRIRIPMIIQELISCMRQKDMSVEGIFRKNGNIRKLREVVESINEDPDNIPDLTTNNAIQLSALLKKFLRDLPDPVMTKFLYKVWIHVARLKENADKQRILSLAYTILPTFNRNVLEVIFSFLFWTASFSHFDNKMGSKMDIHNLSTVMAPNILYFSDDRTPNISPTDKSFVNEQKFAETSGEDYFLGIETIDTLISHHEDMAIVPEFLYELLKEAKREHFEEYDDIKNFVDSKLSKNAIKYSEFEVRSKIKMVNSGSIVIQNKSNNLIEEQQEEKIK